MPSSATTDVKRALVTLAIGDDAAELLAMSGPRFETYAKRIGCDYIPITERRIKYRLQWRKSRVNLHLEKFQMGPMLDNYERVLYLDADILLNDGCPDIFDLSQANELGVVADPSGDESWKRDEEMANMEKAFGALPRPIPPYFNAGVMLLSTTHRELLTFDPKRLRAGRWPDQTYLNYYSAKQNLPRRYLDAKANYLPGHEGWSDPAKRRAAWAVHFAGPEAKPLMREMAASR
jgi:lipopolysaccharide biosynthesis glycosyltransferase